jgi:superfamily II DNA or RNA helicase
MNYERIGHLLLGGAKQKDENKELLDMIAKLKTELKSKESTISNLEQRNAELIEESDKGKRPKTYRPVLDYELVNLQRFLRLKDEVLLHPEIWEYEEGITAFEKNIAKKKDFFRDYQKNFIENWSVSSQEVVILYYGVGSGKTAVAINCAEQFVEMENEGHVYFLMPSSLVLNTIQEMYKFGIDPTRKDKAGNYIYNFISYQQIIRSKLDFYDNSILIIDEAHNLRNFYTKEINEKISGRTWNKTGTYSTVGNVVQNMLLSSEYKFLRTIMMTGTLFVNTPSDIEALIALGYKKAPSYYFDEHKIEAINLGGEEFKNYYGGLISYYRISNDNPSFAKKNFHFTPIEDRSAETNFKIDPYFINSRTEFSTAKIEWTLKKVKECIKKKEKTLIYSQFLGKTLDNLIAEFDDEGIKYGFISGRLNGVEKQQVVKEYNENKIQVLVFTLSIKEGISFAETDNIIILDPYWNYAILEQILARGIRLTSHKKQNKATINLWMLVGVQKNESYIKDWCEMSNFIMNSDIKNLKLKDNESFWNNKYPKIFQKIFDKDKDTGKIETRITNIPLSDSYGSRDIDLYNRMFNKQDAINSFESKLFKTDSFENVNNNENNDFIKEYNSQILELEKENGNTPLKISVKKNLKREMYKEYYKKTIEKTNGSVKRFLDDTRYKRNVNPDIEEIAFDVKYSDKTNDIKKMIDAGKSLTDIFSLFGISKKDITTFQANFTPKNEVEFLIEQSGIKNDTREKIFVLEPTAGIGNVIGGLLNLPNKQNFMIDAVEIHSIFYQIGKAMYSNIDNVKYIQANFLEFLNKYQYHYIIGNPPFNLRASVNVKYFEVIEQNGKKTKEPVWKKEDKTFYDVNFVALAFNQLQNDGVVSMIISDKFLRQSENQPFKRFNQYLEYYELIKAGSVKIVKLNAGFKEDKTITKKMETNFPMVCVTIKRNGIQYMDLSSDENLQELYKLKGIPLVGKQKKSTLNKTSNINKKQKVVKEKKSKKAPKASENTFESLFQDEPVVEEEPIPERSGQIERKTKKVKAVQPKKEKVVKPKKEKVVKAKKEKVVKEKVVKPKKEKAPKKEEYTRPDMKIDDKIKFLKSFKNGTLIENTFKKIDKKFKNDNFYKILEDSKDIHIDKILPILYSELVDELKNSNFENRQVVFNKSRNMITKEMNEKDKENVLKFQNTDEFKKIYDKFIYGDVEEEKEPEKKMIKVPDFTDYEIIRVKEAFAKQNPLIRGQLLMLLNKISKGDTEVEDFGTKQYTSIIENLFKIRKEFDDEYKEEKDLEERRKKNRSYARR